MPNAAVIPSGTAVLIFIQLLRECMKVDFPVLIRAHLSGLHSLFILYLQVEVTDAALQVACGDPATGRLRA